MGTDIHLIAEKRSASGWEVVPAPDRPCWNHASGCRDCHWCGGTLRMAGSWYDDRNYRVFAVLADVRNGYGFGGISTHTPIVPIAGPRGLPVDLGTAAREWFDNDAGDHTESWLLLAEVLAYDWDQTLRYRDGQVSLRGSASVFLDCMEALEAAASALPTDVRIVFNFDS